MAVIDISLPIRPSMVIWPGDPAVELVRRKRIEDGASSNVSQLRLGTHTGTHVDPPYHFLPQGPTVDQLPLEVLIGPAQVIHLPGRQPVTPARLEEALGASRPQRLLLRTGNSQLWAGGEPFTPGYSAPDAAAARWLVQQGTRLLGVDYLSVERFRPGDYLVHRTLLGAGVVVVEGLDLSAVEPGEYQLVCLPLRIEGGDGAPARAVLLT